MRRIFILLAVGILFHSCRKETPTPIPQPGKVVMISPEKDQLCTTGTPISTSQSTVVFKWNASPNTTSYDLVYKDLETGSIETISTTAPEMSATLFRGRPYSWYVISKSNQTSTTQKSDTWKFYNAGVAISTVAPYPAEIVSPKMGQHIAYGNGKVKLEWIGSTFPDPASGTIVDYDIYFGTGSTPVLYKADHTGMFLDNVPVSANTTYYWQVITWSSNGYSSSSGIFQFRVN